MHFFTAFPHPFEFSVHPVYLGSALILWRVAPIREEE
jgi:hypothetical protein